MITATTREKLLNHEVAPPGEAWRIISEELIESKEFIPLSDKLSDYEVAPPPLVWSAIVTNLDEHKNEASPQPEKAKYRLLFRIMAAATLIGLIVLGTFLITGISILKNKITSIKKHQTELKIVQKEAFQIQKEPVSVQSKPINMQLLPTAISFSIPRNNQESSKVLRNTKVTNPPLPDNAAGIMIAAKPIRNQYGDIIQDTKILKDLENQYISITGPNGQQTKISSKFLHMLLFINDDSDIDQVEGYFDKNFLESLIWKPRFQDWRKKILNTSLVPSATNFMDILEFKDLIMNDN